KQPASEERSQHRKHSYKWFGIGESLRQSHDKYWSNRGGQNRHESKKNLVSASTTQFLPRQRDASLRSFGRLTGLIDHRLGGRSLGQAGSLTPHGLSQHPSSKVEVQKQSQHVRGGERDWPGGDLGITLEDAEQVGWVRDSSVRNLPAAS